MTEQKASLILSEGPVSRFQVLGRRPQLRAGVALVYTDSRGGVLAVQGLPTRGEIAFRSYTRQYEVDVSRHLDQIPVELPSRADSFVFRCEFGVVWRVADPAQVVRDQVTDGIELIGFHLLHQLRPISREYDIEQYGLLEQRINTLFGSASAGDWHRVPGGVELQLNVRVGLDEAGRASSDAWRGKVLETGLIDVAQDLARKKQEYEQELARSRHQHETALETERQHGEMEMERLRHDLALERQRQQEKFDLEREAGRTQLYLDAMRMGDGAMLALHLGRHPDDTSKVITMIAENNAINNKARIDLLVQMIDNGHIQEADMGDLRPEIVQGVQELLGKRQAGFGAGSPLLGLGQAPVTVTAEQEAEFTAAPEPPAAEQPPVPESPAEREG